MKAPSDLAARNGSAQPDAYQAHVAALQDRLLLFLRDGEWRPVADLAAWLAPRAPAELTVPRYLAAGGSPGRKLDFKCGE